MGKMNSLFTAIFIIQKRFNHFAYKTIEVKIDTRKDAESYSEFRMEE